MKDESIENKLNDIKNANVINITSTLVFTKLGHNNGHHNGRGLGRGANGSLCNILNSNRDKINLASTLLLSNEKLCFTI